jgi:hypothetical protein
MKHTRLLPLVSLSLLSLALAVPAWAKKDKAEEKAAKPTSTVLTKCTMTYNLKGWSAIYKTASGEGKVTCENGQSTDVVIKVKGGGLTAGKTDVVEGHGDFSGLRDISEVYGGYAAASAHAGAVKASEAAVYTKGEVSLALVGTGRGFSLGVDFGKLTIKKK